MNKFNSELTNIKVSIMATIENGSTGTNSKRKAAAFINVHAVSSKDSESKKSLGGIPLYADYPFHAALLEHVKNGGEITLETGIHIVSAEVEFDF